MAAAPGELPDAGARLRASRRSARRLAAAPRQAAREVHDRRAREHHERRQGGQPVLLLGVEEEHDHGEVEEWPERQGPGRPVAPARGQPPGGERQQEQVLDVHGGGQERQPAAVRLWVDPQEEGPLVGVEEVAEVGPDRRERRAGVGELVAQVPGEHGAAPARQAAPGVGLLQALVVGAASLPRAEVEVLPGHEPLVRMDLQEVDHRQVVDPGDGAAHHRVAHAPGADQDGHAGAQGEGGTPASPAAVHGEQEERGEGHEEDGRRAHQRRRAQEQAGRGGEPPGGAARDGGEEGEAGQQERHVERLAEDPGDGDDRLEVDREEEPRGQPGTPPEEPPAGGPGRARADRGERQVPPEERRQAGPRGPDDAGEEEIEARRTDPGLPGVPVGAREERHLAVGEAPRAQHVLVGVAREGHRGVEVEVEDAERDGDGDHHRQVEPGRLALPARGRTPHHHRKRRST